MGIPVAFLAGFRAPLELRAEALELTTCDHVELGLAEFEVGEPELATCDQLRLAKLEVADGALGRRAGEHGAREELGRKSGESGACEELDEDSGESGARGELGRSSGELGESDRSISISSS